MGIAQLSDENQNVFYSAYHCLHHRKSVFLVTRQKQAGALLWRRRKPHSDHICANGQITEVSTPNGLTTQSATDSGGMDGNISSQE